jgi:hypothetical protein
VSQGFAERPDVDAGKDVDEQRTRARYDDDSANRADDPGMDSHGFLR